MKKGLFIVISMFCAVSMMAQETLVKDSMLETRTNSEIGYYPYDTTLNKQASIKNANWSLIPHVGFNLFDGDFNFPSELQHPINFPSLGLDFEYDFTPVFGLGVEYMYSRYGTKGRPGHASTLLNGHMHKAGAYLSMDLMGLFYPRGKSKIFCMNLMAGGGYGWYKSTAYFKDDAWDDSDPITATHKKGNTLNYINENGDAPGTPDAMTSYNGAAYLQAGVNFEFNITRVIALGVRGTYSYMLSDAIDGRGTSGRQSIASKNNDGVLDVTLNMRIKFTADKNSHVRNMGGIESSPILAQAMSHPSETFAPVHDTLIIYRDTVIIRETIVENVASTQIAKQHFNVYFDNNESELNEKGLITIQQASERMMENPDIYAVVVGYCDNTGTRAVNETLAKKRADNIAEELREEYAIDPSHIFAFGHGLVVGRRSQAAYAPNRRAVVELMDKEAFDKRCAELLNEKNNRPYEEQEVVSTKEEILARFADRTGKEVTVENATTLAHLARKHYNNTHCWVYIYAANKAKLANPSSVTPGMKLTIPEITENEQKISKEKCLRMYGIIRK